MSLRSEVIRIFNELVGAGKKITELPAATTPLAGTELLEIVQGGTNRKITASNLSSGGTGVQSVVAGTNVTVDATDPQNPIVSASGGGGGGTWGSITGTLSDQTDLQGALDAKQPTDADLTAIAALGFVAESFLKKTAAGTWTLDTNTYLPIVGGTLTGFLFLDADPTQLFHAATKQYVDNTVNSKTVVDGATITGAGTTGSPWVAAGLQPSSNLSDVSSATTSRANLAASADRVTINPKAANFTPALSDFTGIQPLYECTNTLTLTLPSDATQAIPIGKILYGTTASTKTVTFSPDSGVTLTTSSGGYTVTPNGTADFVFWSCTKKAANTWFVQIGSPPATSPFSLTFLASTSTFTNMPSGVQELPTTNRFRTKADLSNYQQVRVTVGVSTAGSTNAGFYLQYSTDDSSFTDIGTASGSDLAVIGTTGTKVSGWVNLPSGAKADVFLRCVSISGDGAADPVVGTIIAQFR